MDIREAENQIGRSDRRQTDPQTLRALEVLDITEAELVAANAKLRMADQALEAARQREQRLFENLEKGQTRLQRILLGTVVTATIVIILLVAIAAYLIQTHAY